MLCPRERHAGGLESEGRRAVAGGAVTEEDSLGWAGARCCFSGVCVRVCVCVHVCAHVCVWKGGDQGQGGHSSGEVSRARQ